MAKHKEEKTNVMRTLDQKKIPYTAHTYDPDGPIDGVSVAAALGQELSAFGWALYNLDDEDEYLFALIPEEERSEWERYCKKQGQYCHLMKQQGRKWGDHAKEQDPGKLMPCEEYILQDEYDYFFNSVAGDFAAGEWKNQDAEEWKNGCVADLRQRPPQVTRAHSLPHLGCLTYSAENDSMPRPGPLAAGLLAEHY